MSTQLVVGTEDGETTVLMVLPEGGPPGPQGQDGTSIDWQGAWDIGAAYAENDGVLHLDAAWVATESTDPGDEPGTSPKWSAIADLSTPVQTATNAADAAAGSASDASGFRDDAEAARAEAEKWADNPEDDPVETDPDRYSALHHAAKAEASAQAAEGHASAASESADDASGFADAAGQSAQTAAGHASDASDSADAAAGSANNAGQAQTAAEAARDKAAEWADNAEDDPVETDPDRYSALHWSAKAEGHASDADGAAQTAQQAQGAAESARDEAQGYASNASDSADEAEGYRDEVFDALTVQINAQTGTTYTLAASDIDKLVTLANTDPITLTLPTDNDVTWPVGRACMIQQADAGQVTVDPDDGVTLNATEDALRAQWSAAVLLKTAADTWTMMGDTEEAAS